MPPYTGEVSKLPPFAGESLGASQPRSHSHAVQSAFPMLLILVGMTAT